VRMEQGEQRLHRGPSAHGQDRRNSNNRSKNRNNSRNNSFNRNNNSCQQSRGGNRGRSNANGNGNSSSSKYCTFHRTTTHNTQDCCALQQNRQQEEHQQADHQRDRTSRQGGGQANNQQTRVEQRTHGSSDEEYMFVGIRDPAKPSPAPMRIMIKLKRGKDQYHALLDSGCSRSDFMQELQSKDSTLETSSVSFTLAEGSASS
jgi:hypothetical protein